MKFLEFFSLHFGNQKLQNFQKVSAKNVEKFFKSFLVFFLQKFLYNLPLII